MVQRYNNKIKTTTMEISFSSVGRAVAYSAPEKSYDRIAFFGGKYALLLHMSKPEEARHFGVVCRNLHVAQPEVGINISFSDEDDIIEFSVFY